MRALGSDITYGAGGPEVQVIAQWSKDGSTWTNLFSGLDIDGGESETLADLASGTRVSIKATGSYGALFRRSYVSTDGTGHVEVLRDGDRAPDYPVFGDQDRLHSYVRSLIGTDGRVDIGEFDVILLMELGDLGSSAADFQDLVLHVQFTQEAGSCVPTTGSAASGTSSVTSGTSATSVSSVTGDPQNPRFKVVFDRLANTGNGNANRIVFVGPQATQYAENAWIPLKLNGVTQTDSGLNENVTGISVQRLNGILRVLLHGSHGSDASKEIVDAKIVFEGVAATGFENDTGQNATENPADDSVHDGPGGDEVSFADNGSWVLYQTRVTTGDDAVYIYWEGSPGAGGSGDGSVKVNGKRKLTICHFGSDGSTRTLMVSANAWSGHAAHGDHLGSCESDDDGDAVSNYQDLCPGTRVDAPRKYLLFWRYGLTEKQSDIFRVGPTKKVGEFDVQDTMGCSCEQLLDVAEGKPGYYFTNLPKLYLQLRSLLDFYVSTARKFGCSRDLLRLIEKTVR